VKTDRHILAIGVVVLLGCCDTPGDAATQATPTVRPQVVGAWQLESRMVRTANGEILLDPVLGKQPAGRLIYDASGHMALQMMRQDRLQAISVPAKARDSDNPRIVLGYDSYFGTFEVNARAGTITHHVEGSLFPEDLGKDFERRLTVDGDTLTLSFTSKSPEGVDITRTLRFRRLTSR